MLGQNVYIIYNWNNDENKELKELINDYVSESELKDSVMNLALTISQKSMKNIKIGKEAFYKQLYLDLSDAYEYTSAIMAENVQEDYAIEGINAFLEKRDPNWNDN